MDSSTPIPPSTAQPCEILVPVFNGYESVKRCLDSVLAHSPPDCTIHILDDASSDLRLLSWLDELEAREPRVSVKRADENLGFVGNVNRGLASARGDVILLNSDTLVTPGWVEKLLACAASDPRIALVCPLSNNATILSVPLMNGDNPIPDGLGVERFGALVESVAARRYPRLPVAVGFCMLIRRPALQRLGLLHRAYHRGYGEECDYSLRAWEAGFEVACCDDTFVYHEGEQSFGAVAGMETVKRRNESVLLARWPFYNALVRRFCQLDPLRDVQERILTGLAQSRGDRAPHILYVLHSYHALGGTELHSRALATAVSETYRATVLFPDETDPYLDYSCVVDHEWFRVLAYQRALTEGRPRLFGHVAALRNAVVESSFARMVAGGAVDLVHFQHLLNWGTLELPLIARRLGATVVLSLHDYFLFCPVFDMLRPDGTPCGKARAEAEDPECLHCLAHQAPADMKTRMDGVTICANGTPSCWRSSPPPMRSFRPRASCWSDSVAPMAMRRRPRCGSFCMDFRSLVGRRNPVVAPPFGSVSSPICRRARAPIGCWRRSATWGAGVTSKSDTSVASIHAISPPWTRPACTATASIVPRISVGWQPGSIWRWCPRSTKKPSV
jgi:GT2 family glycosyltransferase